MKRVHQELCELFVASGCDKEAKDNRGYTALHIASWAGNTGLCKLLLSAGCDKAAKNDSGNTPLHLAVLSSSTFEVQKNAKNDQGHTPMSYCREGSLETYLRSRGCVRV